MRTNEPSKCVEVKGRVIQISLKGIDTEQSKKGRKTAGKRPIRKKMVSNMGAKALSSLQTLKGFCITG